MKQTYPPQVLKPLHCPLKRLTVFLFFFLLLAAGVKGQCGCEPFPDPVILTVPEFYEGTTCMTQADVDAAFEDWLAEVSYSGGCNAQISNDVTSAPSYCGGSVTVEWTVTSDCEEPVVKSATFIIPAAPAVLLTVPSNYIGTTCMTQTDVDAAYTAFINGTSFSGSCGASISNNAPANAPSFCGGSVIVTWTVASDCEDDVVKSAEFSIPEKPNLIVYGPETEKRFGCFTQEEVDGFFNDWINNFSFVGGCSATETDLSNLVAPPACGGAVPVNFIVTDVCGQSESYFAAFEVESPLVELTVPTNQTINNPVSQEALDVAFLNWLNQAILTGGCGANISRNPANPIPPILCGGSTTVTWTVSSNCSVISESRVFSVSRNKYKTIASGNWEDNSVWEFGCVPSFNGGLANWSEIIINHDVVLNSSFYSGKNTNSFSFLVGEESSCTLIINDDFIVERSIDLIVFPGSILQIGNPPLDPEHDYCANDQGEYRKSLFWVQGSQLSPSLTVDSEGIFLLYGDFLVENNFDIRVKTDGHFIVLGGFEANNNAAVNFIGAGGDIGCDMVFKNSSTITLDGGDLNVGGDLLFMNGGFIYMNNGSNIDVVGLICSSPGGGSAALYIYGDGSEPPNIVNYGDICVSTVIGDSGVILPIELLTLDADVFQNGINLLWTTGSEINNDYFSIERSRDAYGWEVLGFVPGAGNSSVPLSYSFSDMQPLDGLAYYRLKQTDFDGQFKYYGPIAAHYDLGLEGLDFKVLKQYTNWIIAVPQDGVYQVEVYTLTGRRLVSERTENTLTIPAPEGGVVIRVTDGYARSTSRVVM